jgi:Transposase DDE domain
MDSIAQVEQALRTILQERANVLARETGCIIRQRKLTGATLAQTLIFSWQQHPQASLEQMASMAEVAAVSLTDTAVHNRFTPACAQFLRRLLEEMSAVVVQAAEPVAVELLRRFTAVLLEDSSVISLPPELHEQWSGCGNQNESEAASLKLHVRWELQRGRLDGPALTAGRLSDRRSPWYEVPIEVGALYVQDLGYFSLARIAQRREAGAWSLSRLQAGTHVLDRQGHQLSLPTIAPKQVGQTKELTVLVGSRLRLPMRLLMLRVPKAVADERRERLQADAKRRGQTVSPETLALADWTLLITDVAHRRLSLTEALVLLRERWQMELLYKLWKQDGQVDEWRTANPWRILCEVYAKLLGLLLQHWLIVLFAWHDAQRSLVKLAQVCRDTSWTLMEALAGFRWLRCALHLIARRMRSGCQMNKRQQRPNSAQLLEQAAVEWALSTA